MARARKEAEARLEDEAVVPAHATDLTVCLPAGEVLLQQCSKCELAFLLEQVRIPCATRVELEE